MANDNRPRPRWLDILLAAGLLVGIAMLAFLLARMDRQRGGGTPLIPSRRTPQLIISKPGTVNVFDGVEIVVQFPDELKGFEQLPEDQFHDAYDADRNGVFADLSAEFVHADGDHRMTVPGFAMKDKPDGLWSWHIRWSPDRTGEWTMTVMFRGRAAWNQQQLTIRTPVKNPIKVIGDAKAMGPLRMPQGDENPNYLRAQRADGTSSAVWMFGNCRAWVVGRRQQKEEWRPDEWLDRDRELLPPLREGGFNLLNQWMAPWEFLLIHHDRAEFWRQPDGSWKRIAMPNQIQWAAQRNIDQGRALAFDQLVASCEGDDNLAPIRLLLTPLPHNCFQTRGHPWAAEGHSGFSPEDDRSGERRDRLLGLSDFRPGMWIWDFFDADPKQPLSDWRSKLFDHQANFFRYLIARWGYSKAIGMWVIMDELEGVGDHLGIMADKSGWWRSPQCDRWLGDMVKMFRGELTRSDGKPYAGDPFRHPLHASTSSTAGQAQRGGNLDWQGGPAGARVDILGWHWYPQNPDAQPSWAARWLYVIDGISSFAQAPGNHIRLISEFGAYERAAPNEPPSNLHPTVYHHAIWAGIFSGLAGTPMDWDDGKEYGELRARKGTKAFAEEIYPIDHVAEMQVLRKFLADLEPEQLAPTLAKDSQIRFHAADSTRVFGLYDRQNASRLYGWLFAADPTEADVIIKGLPAGNYDLVWYDPWTGDLLTKDNPTQLTVDESGSATIAAGPILTTLAPKVGKSFPTDTRMHKGHDLAFRIVPRK